MTTTLARPPVAPRVATQPTAPLRALAGVVAALAAVGVGHGVAGLLNPVASPLIAVGSTLIDAAPTPAKEFAVRTFGTYDKPILLGSIAAVLLVFAAGLGLIAWRRRLVAMIGISLLGVAGMAAAITRGSLVDGIPSLIAGAVGVLALMFLTGTAQGVPARRRSGVRAPVVPAAGRRRDPGGRARRHQRIRVRPRPAGPGGRPSGPGTAGCGVRREADSRRAPRSRGSASSSPRWRSSTGWTSAWSPRTWT